MLLDTNVVLDVLLAREPFVHEASRIFAMVERGQAEGLLCATTLTTVDYLLARSLPGQDARAAVRRLLGLFKVAAVNRAVLDAACSGSMPDSEEAILAESANQAGAERIVTRNTRDFARSPVVAVDPAEFLGLFPGDEPPTHSPRTPTPQAPPA